MFCSVRNNLRPDLRSLGGLRYAVGLRVGGRFALNCGVLGRSSGEFIGRQRRRRREALPNQPRSYKSCDPRAWHACERSRRARLSIRRHTYYVAPRRPYRAARSQAATSARKTRSPRREHRSQGSAPIRAYARCRSRVDYYRAKGVVCERSASATPTDCGSPTGPQQEQVSRSSGQAGRAARQTFASSRTCPFP